MRNLPLQNTDDVSQVCVDRERENFLSASWAGAVMKDKADLICFLEFFPTVISVENKIPARSSVSPPLLQSLLFGSKLMISIWKHRLSPRKPRANKRSKKNELEQPVGTERPAILWYKTKILVWRIS